MNRLSRTTISLEFRTVDAIDVVGAVSAVFGRIRERSYYDNRASPPRYHICPFIILSVEKTTS